jgi:RNA polymerase sigma-70 factor (ECF subfamily)
MSHRLPPEERFEEIYRRHLDTVVAYVRRRASHDAVEDVVAETFLVCWRRLDRVPDQALPWLYAVARKLLANQRRASARGRHAPWGLALDQRADPAAVRDPALRTAFARLSERDRELLALVAWEGLTLAETAGALGCSPLACRVRLHRAKRRLAQRLDEAEELSSRPHPTPHPRGGEAR